MKCILASFQHGTNIDLVTNFVSELLNFEGTHQVDSMISLNGTSC